MLRQCVPRQNEVLWISAGHLVFEPAAENHLLASGTRKAFTDAGSDALHSTVTLVQLFDPDGRNIQRMGKILAKIREASPPT